jgi:hypothetical protein
VDGRYVTEFVLKLVYERGCVTKREIVSLFRERFREKVEGRSPKYVDNLVGNALRRLVRRGAIARKGWGVYCRAT